METVQISLDKNIVENASTYAKERGVELSSMIEGYLLDVIKNEDARKEEDEFPDVVQSLLGAGMPVSDDDLNGRKALYSHLLEE